MAKKKVYLPKWQRFYVLPIVGGVWVMITYLEFFSENEDEKLGLIGYLLISAVMLLILIMTWLMTSGKLPAYLIDDGEDSKN